MKKIMAITLLILFLLAGYALATFPSLLFAQKGYSKAEMSKLTIVAHRGGASIGLENSLSCIQKGIDTGADMIEIDIHLTADGEVVVCHDQSIDRTTDGNGLIREMKLQEIRKFHLKDAAGNVSNETLPTLDEVMDLVAGKCRMLIEIKRTQNIYQGIERKLIDAIYRHNAKPWVVVQSFNDSVLEIMHATDSTIRLEKLLFCKFPLLPIIFDGTFSSFSYEKYSYVESFNFFYGGASDTLIDTLHKHGKEVKIWTLEAPEDARHLNVDAIIANRPDLWRD